MYKTISLKYIFWICQAIQGNEDLGPDLWWLSGKRICLQCRRQFQSLGQEDIQEKGLATHSSILTWEIPWTEKRGGPQSMELQELDMT